MLGADALTGLRVLDVGCGPIPYAAAFTGCDITGIDPLIDGYRALGYPLDGMEYVCAPAEAMPFADDSFDAVISMNALDHVDDFGAVAREIQRVARGLIRIEVHYHAPTVTEPLALDDDIVRECFPTLVKLREKPYAEFYPWATGTVAVWSSR
jgi:ubiquinone/menaquinone biosynthesis C-methylase UbiE